MPMRHLRTAREGQHDHGLVSPGPAAVAVAAIAFGVYAATLTQNWTGDSIRFAQVVESPEVREILAPHRMLIHPIGLGFFRLWQLSGWPGSALLPLQVITALAGAVSVGLIYLLARHLTCSSVLAALVSAGFAVSAGTWLFSTEAELIMVPVAINLAILCRLLTPHPKDAARPLHAMTVGLSTGLSTLTWLTGILLVPVALICVWLAEGVCWGARARRAALLVASVGVVVVPAYLLNMTLAFGVRDWQGVLGWRLYGGGSGTADLLYGQLAWSSLPHGVYGFLRTIAWYPDLDVGASTSFYLAQADWPRRAAFAAFHGLVLLVAVTPILLALARRRALATSRRALAVLGSWAALFGAFAIYWVPGDTQFWVPVLAVWWLFVGIVASAYLTPGVPTVARGRTGPLPLPDGGGTSLAAAVVLCVTVALAAINGLGLALPNRALERNRPYQLAISVRERTNPGDLILTGGGEALFLYIPYFAERRTISLFHELLGARGSPDDVLASIDRDIAAARARGDRVFVVGPEPGRDMWSHVTGTVRETNDYLRQLNTRPAWQVEGEPVLEVIG
jgi:hypothetical protein